MKFWDGLKSFFGFGQEIPVLIEPPKPAMREEKRPIINIVNRSYDGAIPSELNMDWMAWSTSGSYEVLNGWRRLCYYARDLERNNPHCRAFLREICSNVFGPKGIGFESKIKNQRGEGFNKKLNSLVSAAYEDFCKKGNYEVTGQWNSAEVDELILRAMARDGGCLVRLKRGYKGNKHRFAVQLLEIDALDLWYNTVYGQTGNRVTTGVETDSEGKVVAYHLLDYSEADLMANNTVGKRVRVDASDIIHVWMPERITSVRGVSLFASVLLNTRMLGKFEEAVTVAKRAAASKMGFYERTQDAEHYEGQDETKTGEIVEEISAGSLIELPAGVTFRPVSYGDSSEDYDKFRKNALRSIASGVGMNYNTLSQDLEHANYSSIRFGKEPEIDWAQRLQAFMIDTVKQRVFAAWAECAMLADIIPVDIDQLVQVISGAYWRPRGFEYIDPLKDVQADMFAISFGLNTRTNALAKRGLDYDETMDQLEHEKEVEKEKGLTFTDPTGRNPVESTQENPDATPGAQAAEGSGSDQKPKK